MIDTHSLHDIDAVELSVADVGASGSNNLTIGQLIRRVGIDPAVVRLVRHQDPSSDPGKTPYDLWLNHRELFESYQSHQSEFWTSRLNGAYWASFVGTADGSTLFVGLYRVNGWRPNQSIVCEPNNGVARPVGSINVFDLTLLPELSDLVGKLYVEWGAAPRIWAQRAHRSDKPVVEIHGQVPDRAPFPGYLDFAKSISELPHLLPSWKAALTARRGVYLLTCPHSGEKYVGAATGTDGFFGRLLDYVSSGHGGNKGLLERDPTNYRVTILQVADETDDVTAILGWEKRWKDKLQTREFGLNRN